MKNILNNRTFQVIAVLILLYFVFTEMFKEKKSATGTTADTQTLDRYMCVGGTTGNLCAKCIDPLDPDCTTMRKCEETCLGSPANQTRY